jgi:hypothetical protein
MAGPTILEMMWQELDSVVDRLMEDGAQAEDGRDPGRAEGVAYCIAIITNPYEVNIEAIREEAMVRWETRTTAE